MLILEQNRRFDDKTAVFYRIAIVSLFIFF